jgi:hypothetical protein
LKACGLAAVFPSLLLPSLSSPPLDDDDFFRLRSVFDFWDWDCGSGLAAALLPPSLPSSLDDDDDTVDSRLFAALDFPGGSSLPPVPPPPSLSSSPLEEEESDEDDDNSWLLLTFDLIVVFGFRDCGLVPGLASSSLPSTPLDDDDDDDDDDNDLRRRPLGSFSLPLLLPPSEFRSSSSAVAVAARSSPLCHQAAATAVRRSQS